MQCPQCDKKYHEIKGAKGREGGTHKASECPRGTTRPPIRWRAGPTVVLVCIVHMALQVALPAIKVHLPMKQLVLILSVLLLPIINGVEP